MDQNNMLRVVTEKVSPLDLSVHGLECPFCKSIFAYQSWLRRANYCPSCGKGLVKERELLGEDYVKEEKDGEA